MGIRIWPNHIMDYLPLDCFIVPSHDIGVAVVQFVTAQFVAAHHCSARMLTGIVTPKEGANGSLALPDSGIMKSIGSTA
jgi:hypothetical protein